MAKSTSGSDPWRVDLVILIHGTWGHGSSLANPSSPISLRLAKEFQAPVECFRWSGHNSHRARIEAAYQLTERLKMCENQRVALVAHSHGGNVALAAARMSAENPVKIKVITLGTPFLVHGRDMDRLSLIPITTVSSLCALSLLALFAPVPELLLKILWGLVCVHLIAQLYSLRMKRWIRRERLGHVLLAMGCPPPNSAFIPAWKMGGIKLAKAEHKLGEDSESTPERKKSKAKEYDGSSELAGLRVAG